jgi:hypothetical protein
MSRFPYTTMFRIPYKKCPTLPTDKANRIWYTVFVLPQWKEKANAKEAEK